jgi:P4 family phage/plasmid primase-like protien
MSNISNFVTFSQTVLGSEDVSLRLIPESAACKKLAHEKVIARVVQLPSGAEALNVRCEKAKNYNDQGYAVYYQPQVLVVGGDDESGRSITHIRALIVDLDGAPLEPALALEIPPTAVVNTSPGKYQCIWRLSEEVVFVHENGTAASQGCRSLADMRRSVAETGFIEYLTTKEYALLSHSLTELLAGDVSVCKAPQVFRCPGFNHHKGAPFTSAVIQEVSEKVSINDLIKMLDGLDFEKRLKGEKGSEHEKGKLLDSLSRGEGRVGKGERHSMIVSLARRFSGKGMQYEEIVDEIEKVVAATFDEPTRFWIGGDRYDEVCKAARDCIGYQKKEDAEHEEEKRRILNELGLDSSKLGPSEPYNFKQGLLSIDRYSESALEQRAVQKFGGSMARLKGDFLVFNQTAVEWEYQNGDKFEIVKDFTVSVITDVICEPEWRDGFVDDEGGEDRGKLAKAIRGMFKLGLINMVCHGVMNSSAVKRLEFKDFEWQVGMFRCVNGLLDLKTGVLREVVRSDRCIHKGGVEWNEYASCPRWLKFLSEVFSTERDPLVMVEFIREVFAYSLSGEIKINKIFCYLGDGCNGKSTMLNMLKRITGSYWAKISPNDLTIGKNDSSEKMVRINTELRGGKRLGILDDFSASGTWNEGFVKDLTDESLLSRALFKERSTEPNRAKFHIGMNVAPKPENNNLGIFRRLCFIPCNTTFIDSTEKKIELEQMIVEEAAGVLRWAQSVYHKVITKGLTYPAGVLRANQKYEKEHDPVPAALTELYLFPSVERGGEWVATSTVVEEVSTYLAEINDGIGLHFGSQPNTVFGCAFRKLKALVDKRRFNNSSGKISVVYLIKRGGEGL